MSGIKQKLEEAFRKESDKEFNYVLPDPEGLETSLKQYVTYENLDQINIGILGFGQDGAVFKISNNENNQQVAMKLSKTDLCHEEKWNVAHGINAQLPSVTYHRFPETNRNFIFMKCYEQTLDQYLDKDITQSEKLDAIASFFAQLPFDHNDLKPENVFIEKKDDNFECTFFDPKHIPEGRPHNNNAQVRLFLCSLSQMSQDFAQKIFGIDLNSHLKLNIFLSDSSYLLNFIEVTKHMPPENIPAILTKVKNSVSECFKQKNLTSFVSQCKQTSEFLHEFHKELAKNPNPNLAEATAFKVIHMHMTNPIHTSKSNPPTVTAL